MLDICRGFERIPIQWRLVIATGIPLAIGLIAYPFIGFWAFFAAAFVAVASVWHFGRRHNEFFRRTAFGIMRTRSIDRRHRLATDGPVEQRRIANAVNRLADRVQQTIQESDNHRRYYETILNELTVGILVVDANGNLQYANPAAGEMLGFTYDGSAEPMPLAAKVNLYEVNEAITSSIVNGSTIRRDVEIYDTRRHLEILSRPLLADDSGLDVPLPLLTIGLMPSGSVFRCVNSLPMRRMNCARQSP